MINRSAVLIRPKQPYIDWASTLDDSEVVPEIDGEKTIYLIPEYDSPEQGWIILRKYYEDIFENELLGWHTYEPEWPQDRSYKMFKEWFDIEFHSTIEDLVGGSIIDDIE